VLAKGGNAIVNTQKEFLIPSGGWLKEKGG